MEGIRYLYSHALGLLLVCFLTAGLSQYIHRNSGSQIFSGYIYEQPSINGMYKTFTLDNRKISVSRYYEIIQGDYIELDFSSCSYDAKYKSYSNCDLSRVGQSWILEWIYKIRNTIISNAKKRLPSPQDALVLAMTIGYKDDLPDLLTRKLTEIGAIHMLVVSGYNVSLVLSSSSILLARLNKWQYFILSLLFLLVFVFIVGFSAPVVRSAIMGTFIVVGRVTGRQSRALYMLVVSGLLMVAWDISVLSSISFQLSFLATLGVIIFGYLINTSSNLLSNIAASAGANILVLPILSFNFGTVSYLGMISTVLLSWLVPFITFLGIFIFFVDVSLLNWICALIVDFFLLIVDVTSYFSFLNLDYKLSLKGVILYYIFAGILIYLLFKLRQNLNNDHT